MVRAERRADPRHVGWRPWSAQSPENRRRILAELYPERDDRRHWRFRFAVMMSLSVVVAVMGLSEGSDAVVIGAMLIAPLMTPVLGIAASLAMAWPRRVGQSLLATAAGTAGAVAVAWAITAVLPSSDKAVTTQVLARTSPDLRDLFIGLAAGAAGAYATAREDVSAALPGVAVAVALVPPLATTGFTLAIGRGDLAAGAMLLYVTNLVAIVLAATLVFLASGFVPQGRRERAATRIRLGVALLVVAVAAVAVPLTSRSVAAIERAGTTRRVNDAALAWLSAYPSLRLGTVSIKGRAVTVQVVGPEEPPTSASLAMSLRSVLGPDAAVRVQWFQTGSTPSLQPIASTTSLSPAELSLVVEAWLATVPGAPARTRITGISASGNAVTVSLEGPLAPPPASSLAQLIGEKEGRTVNVSVNWSAPTVTTAPPTTAPSATTSTLPTVTTTTAPVR